MPYRNQVLAVILGGGQGSRLYPLTQMRSKPAVPIAGKYRLIDVPISNCINSGFQRVAILTQFNSISLHRHVSSTYQFDVFHPGWVQIWAAEQTMESTDWYQGTADAVRKQLFEIKSTNADYVLILAGDHLYRMDYSKMFDFHLDRNADVTVAVQPASREDAPRLGILKQNAAKKIVEFAEKPKDPQSLARMVSREDPEKPYLGSMGIYLFKTSVLLELLENNTHPDFGKQIIPLAIQSNTVFGYEFEGYWEDIGTIRSFYETNLALTMPNPPFNIFDAENPIFTHARFLPGSSIQNSHLENVVLAEGCMIEDAEITHSLIGVRSQILSGTRIRDTYLMGADYYSHPMPSDCDEPEIPIGIGCDCDIEGAIIDKNVRFGRGVVIHSFPRGTDLDGKNFVVRDGIVVIPKKTVLPAGTYIGPE